MADKTISALTAASSVAASTALPVVRDGASTTEKATLAQVAAQVVVDSTAFTQAGTGAVARSIAAKLGEAVSVTDFGASTASSDNTLAFQAAADTGRSLYVPPGTYSISGTVTFTAAGQGIFSDGRSGPGGATLLFTGTGTSDCLAFGTADAESVMPFVSDIDIQAPGRLGGAAIHFRRAYRAQVNRLRIKNVYNGVVNTRALGTKLGDVLMVEVRGDYGVALLNQTLGAGSDILELMHVTVAGHASIISSTSGKRCTALYLDNAGSVLMHGFKALNGCGTGLKAVRTDTEQTVGGGFINAFLFACEYMADDGVVLEAGHRWVFTSPYIFAAQNGAGVIIGEDVTNVQFIGGDIASNKLGGAVVHGEGVEFKGVCIALNGPNPYINDGIEIEATAKHVRITGCQIGRRTYAQGGQRYGVRVAAGAENVVIAGNDFTGNVTAAISNSATAGQVKIRGNIGWNDNISRIAVDGTGDFRAGNANGDALRVAAPDTVANRLTISAAATGGSVSIFAEGTDTNIDLKLSAKGTGKLAFGTRTSSSDAPITGYMEVLDSSGALRKLALIG